MKYYYHLSTKEVLQEFHSSSRGLSQKEVSHRVQKYGCNKLPESKKLSILSLFFGQFKNPLIYILFFALIISFATKHYTDGWIIFAIVMLSTTVGFLQEYKANNSLSQLKELIKYKAKVIREGKEMIVGQEELVPGDFILLTPGDKVPADARILEAKNLEVIESYLTGESMPVEKNNKVMKENTAMADRRNMVYLGTVISRGVGKALVTATGINTEIGHIASLVHETEENTTPLQKQIIGFGKVIGIILVIVNMAIFSLGLLMGKPLFEMFLTSVAMLVAGVPEGLLPAMTIILAIGMQRLAKQKGLVRKMLATETLGSVSVICSDKTGTLTQGEMRVVEIITEVKKISHNGESFSEFIEPDGDASHITALKIGLLCNNAIVENPDDEIHNWNIVGNPTEKALLLAGRSAGLHKETLERKLPRITELPFESEKKYMVTGHKFRNEQFVAYIKGALERILPFMSFIDIEGQTERMTELKKRKIQKQCDDLTSVGLRVIAVGYKVGKYQEQDDLKDFVFVGLIAIKDPLRPEVKETIELCKSAGIRPVIITGDHKLTAIAIVKDMGINVSEKNVMDGVELDNISEKKLKSIINKIIIFARVEPRHKIRIVSALQKNGEIVAMTGDGINDTPALKKADIGVAVGSGTDIAKETADLVLLDDNFKTIVIAIKQGRGTFENIRKVTLYLISSSFTEVILIGLSLLFGLPLALLPVQILWMKMLEEPLPAMSLAFDQVNKNVMLKPPRKKDEAILNNNIKKLLVLFIVISNTLLFGIFYYFWETTENTALAQTIAFVGVGIASRFYIFSIRELTKPIISYNPFQNQFVNWSTVFGFLMTILAVYLPFLNAILHTVPLGVHEWTILFAYAIISLIVYEIGKMLFIAREAKKA
jgi:P-type Ca2+ transporter type 2C